MLIDHEDISLIWERAYGFNIKELLSTIPVQARRISATVRTTVAEDREFMRLLQQYYGPLLAGCLPDEALYRLLLMPYKILRRLIKQ